MNSNTPKYIELQNNIINDIKEGILNAGDRILSRNEMIAAYGYSDTTVKKAINYLENQGYVYKVKGKGTFVADQKEEPKTISVIVPFLTSIDNMFHGEEGRLVHVYPLVVQNIEQIAHKKDWRVHLNLYYSDIKKERNILSGLLEKEADCAIYIYHNHKENLDILNELVKSNFPITAVDIYPSEIENISHVSTDNFDGSYNMTKSFIKEGFERVVFFTWHIPHSSTLAREAGYRKAIEEYGLSEEFIVLDDSSASLEPQGIASISKYLGNIFNSNLKTAVISVMPFQHLVLWKAASLADVNKSKIGWGCCDSPNISYGNNVKHVEMIQDFKTMTKKAISVLEQMLTGNFEPQKIKIGYKLTGNLDSIK